MPVLFAAPTEQVLSAREMAIRQQERELDEQEASLRARAQDLVTRATPTAIVLETALMINIRYDDQSLLMKEQAAGLRQLRLDGEAVNAYYTFGKDDKGVGLVRRNLAAVLSTLAEINQQKTAILCPDQETVIAMLDGRIRQVRDSVDAILVPPNLEYVGEGDPPALENYLQVAAWSTPIDGQATPTVFGIVCVTITVPKLLDPYKTIQRQMDKLGDLSGGVEVYLTHTVTTESLISGDTELLSTIASERNRAAYTYKACAGNPDHLVWCPLNPELMAQALLPQNGILYCTSVKASKKD
jgi:hypothetical protein